MVTKKILFIGYDDLLSRTQVMNLSVVLRDRNIEVRFVEEEEYDQTIGSLAGIAQEKEKGSILSFHSGAVSKITGRFLVMCGVDREEMTELLLLYPDYGIGSKDLKAMLTVNNARWTPLELAGELMREYEKLHGSD